MCAGWTAAEREPGKADGGGAGQLRERGLHGQGGLLDTSHVESTELGGREQVLAELEPLPAYQARLQFHPAPWSARSSMPRCSRMMSSPASSMKEKPARRRAGHTVGGHEHRNTTKSIGE